jgi:hypothetical protein
MTSRDTASPRTAPGFTPRGQAASGASRSRIFMLRTCACPRSSSWYACSRRRRRVAGAAAGLKRPRQGRGSAGERDADPPMGLRRCHLAFTGVGKGEITGSRPNRTLARMSTACSRSAREGGTAAPLRSIRVSAGTRQCEQCGTPFVPRREHARFCSAHCRAAWNREHIGDLAAGGHRLEVEAGARICAGIAAATRTGVGEGKV